MKKTARRSFGEAWECLKPWPESCFVQCGGDGIVLPAGSLEKALANEKEGARVLGEALGIEPAREGAYITAFFEAFPRNPNTFIRGEGATIEEAEAKAWAQFERYKKCPGHRYERRGYRNGAGFCKRCGLFRSKVFSILDRCRYNCGRPAYGKDKAGRGYCRRHYERNPDRMFDKDANGKFTILRGMA